MKTPRNAPQPTDLLFRWLITSLPRKLVLALFVIEMLYRHECPLTLTLRNGLQRSSPPRLPINRATRGKESTNFIQNEGTCWDLTTSAW